MQEGPPPWRFVHGYLERKTSARTPLRFFGAAATSFEHPCPMLGQGETSRWENVCIESFDGRFRNELLDCELFDALLEAKVLIERRRVGTTRSARTDTMKAEVPFGGQS